MEQTDYEKAEAEAWDKFCETELKDRPQWEPISYKQVFSYAFEAAYRYGVWCGMEKAQHSDGNPDHIPEATKKVKDAKESAETFASERTMIAAMAMQGLLSNAMLDLSPEVVSVRSLRIADRFIDEYKTYDSKTDRRCI